MIVDNNNNNNNNSSNQTQGQSHHTKNNRSISTNLIAGASVRSDDKADSVAISVTESMLSEVMAAKTK